VDRHWHVPYPIDKVEVVDRLLPKLLSVEIGYRSAGGRPESNVCLESLMFDQ